MEPARCTSGACLGADGKGIGCFARHLAVMLGAVHPARSAVGALKALTARALGAMQAALEVMAAASALAVRLCSRAQRVRCCSRGRVGAAAPAGVRRVGCAAAEGAGGLAAWLAPCQRALQPCPGAQVESLAALKDARCARWRVRSAATTWQSEPTRRRAHL